MTNQICIVGERHNKASVLMVPVFRERHVVEVESSAFTALEVVTARLMGIEDDGDNRLRTLHSETWHNKTNNNLVGVHDSCSMNGTLSQLITLDNVDHLPRGRKPPLASFPRT